MILDNSKKYSLEEVIELSKKNPDQAYENNDGKVVFNGMVFKNKKELEETIELYKYYKKRPGCFKIMGAIEYILLFRFLKRKKQ